MTHTPASGPLELVTTPPMSSDTILISAAGLRAVWPVRTIPRNAVRAIATIPTYDILLFISLISFGGWAKAKASAIEDWDAQQHPELRAVRNRMPNRNHCQSHVPRDRQLSKDQKSAPARSVTVR